MKLSVIVPVYNVETYIRRCLDSILGQTYENLEIILVDDGSTDRSGDICDEYASKDDRIQVIHKENGGIASARKAGALCVTGEYVTNVDSDDWIEEEAYAVMAEKLKEYHPDMLVLGYKKEYAGFTEEYRQGIEDGYYYAEDFWREFNRQVKTTSFFNQPIDMILWNKAIKTELWKKYQMECPDILKKNVDDAVIFPCLLNIDDIYISSKCLYHYCVRKSSILWNEKGENFGSFVKLSDYLISSYRQGKYKDRLEQDFLLYKLFYHLILDIPEKLIIMDQCGFYPRINAGNNIIIYGKGVFANRLMERMRELHYCKIVDNIDKTDLNRINQIKEGGYDYIVVAILNHQIAAMSMELLTDMGIPRNKILRIEKEDLLTDLLPEEVRDAWKELDNKEMV